VAGYQIPFIGIRWLKIWKLTRALSGLTERLAAVAEVVAAFVVAEVLEQRGDLGFQSVDGPLAGTAKERLESRR